MDTQISNLYLNKDYKPSDGYESFCKDNVDILTKEIKRLFKKYDFITKEFLLVKFKKHIKIDTIVLVAVKVNCYYLFIKYYNFNLVCFFL